MAFEDLTGKKFNKLTVLYRTSDHISSSGKHFAKWHCKCDCGNETDVITAKLKNGTTKSCGCLKISMVKERSTTHGMTRTRIYNIWNGIYTRCYNKNHASYKQYGNRGIAMCPEWLGEHGFENFFEWSMKNGYAENLTIDRIDNDGNYEPTNCRWSDNKEQQRNKRNNFVVSFKGKEVPLSVVSEETGIDRATLSCRIKRGMTAEEAVCFEKEMIEFNGEKKTITQWARDLGISFNTLYSRLHSCNWTVEKALATPARKFNKRKN